MDRVEVHSHSRNVGYGSRVLAALDPEVWKALVNAAIVSVGGGVTALAAGRLIVRRKESIEIRADLLGRTARCAQAMYAACQHANQRIGVTSSTDSEGRLWIARALDDAFFAFSPEAASLRTVLMARYPKRNMRHRADAVTKWCELTDLLTDYYKEVKGAIDQAQHEDERLAGLANFRSESFKNVLDCLSDRLLSGRLKVG